MDNEQLLKISESHPILFYDGVCHLCNQSVQFIIKNDPNKVFRFFSLQKAYENKLLEPSGSSTQLNTVILLYHRKFYYYASAVSLTLILLGKPYQYIGKTIQVLPTFISNMIYKIVAKFRYRIFGKYESCILQTPDIKNLFLDY